MRDHCDRRSGRQALTTAATSDSSTSATTHAQQRAVAAAAFRVLDVNFHHCRLPPSHTDRSALGREDHSPRVCPADRRIVRPARTWTSTPWSSSCSSPATPADKTTRNKAGLHVDPKCTLIGMSVHICRFAGRLAISGRATSTVSQSVNLAASRRRPSCASRLTSRDSRVRIRCRAVLPTARRSARRPAEETLFPPIPGAPRGPRRHRR